MTTSLLPFLPGLNEDVEEIADQMLREDFEAWKTTDAKMVDYGIILQYRAVTIRRREMPVGLAPDRSSRVGVFGRVANTRQTWLNGRVTGYHHHVLDSSGEKIKDRGLAWPLRGDTFQWMR